MVVRPILKPLPGESVLSVQPTLAPEPDVSWNRRLNIHAGRALTDTALTTEQNERGGRLATTGQSHSSGVVSGLEAGLEQTLNQEGNSEFFVHLGAGVGLAASGEMVNLPTPLRVNALSLPVYAPAALLDGEELPSEGGEVVRRLGPALGQALAQEIALPRAGILILQPVVAQIVGRSEAGDPCEIDPTAGAYDDWQRVDGCRLVFFTWPTDVLPLPDPGPAWRNRIAYAIFEGERLAGDDFRWPWDELGVAVGLLALDDAMQPQFIDRYSVVRQGGKAKRRRALIRGGTPFLWQARVQQFAEEVAEAAPLNLPPAQLAEQFNYLPPVGLLPANTLSFDTQTDHFFPGNYHLTARPVPLEQLDGVVRESAPLAPLHRGEEAQVELLVPVPQIWFDPQLLQQEVISPEFDETLTEFITRRTEWLGRRQEVRVIASALNRAITGKDLTFPTPDPEQLDSEEQIAAGPFDPPESNYGTDTNSFTETPIVTATDLNTLRDYLRNSTPLRENEVAKLDELGVEEFIDFLDSKVRGANDTVDLNFLRVQTDIYRLRQQVLGAEEATRLATSPVLAAIAKGDSAYATRQDLENFLTNLKDIPQPPIGTPAPADAPQPSAAPQAAAASGTIGSRPFVSGSSTKLDRITNIGGSLVSGGLGNIDLSSGVSRETINLGIGATKVGGIDVGTIETGPVVVRPPTKDDITEQTQIVGVAYDFRTTSVVERNPEPPAIQTRNAAISTKYSTLTDVLDIGINVDDVVVPGFQGDVTRFSLKEVQEKGLLDQILKGQHDPPIGDDRHESSFFNASVKALENTVAVLRGVEGQIKAYKVALQRSKETLTTIQKNATDADRRLKQIADEVAEARHDVAVARSLMAEEQKRIDDLNARRQKILAEQVTFLVYRRPRVAQAIVQTVAHPIDPGFTQPPITACLNRLVNTPPEIQQLVNLMRRAPVRWFVEMLPLLNLIDRPQNLLLTLQAAKLSALTQQTLLPITTVAAVTTVATSFSTAAIAATSSAAQIGFTASAKLASGISNVLATQQNVVSQVQLNTAAINLSDFVGASWQNNRDRASQIVSIGDLINGAHGKSEIARQAARKLDEIAHVATCLHEAMSDVPPILRLTWAELLSQYDAPVALRNLASLPRWGEIDDVLQRREMQMLVDWLYAQVSPAFSEAVDLISDLVRICILLASHAPVNQIIAGAIHEPVTVKPGGQIKIAVDPALIRIGMPVFVYRDQQVVAQAVVNDLAGGLAAARVTQTMQASLQLDKGAKVQFGEVRTLVRG